MSERLLIRLRADDQLSWLTSAADGRTSSAVNTGVPPAPVLARAQRVIVLAPAEEVLLLSTPRLAGTRAQLLKALPFALEDQLASAVEGMHFAVPDRPGDQVNVAVVARATLRRWLDRLAAEGIRPDALYAETQLLPTRDGACTVLIEERQAYWRRAAAQAGTCAMAELTDLLALLSASEPTLAELDVYDLRAAATPLAMPALNVRRHGEYRDVLAFLAAQAEPEINLLQGEFAPAHRQAPAQQLWRRAAVLAAAALLLLFAWFGADSWRLARQSAQLDAAARALLHEGFPEMDNVAGDPHDLMRSALANLRGGGDSGGLMQLLGRIAPILGSTTRTTLTTLEYHNATLELGLRAPDVPALDLMRERLAGLGLKVEVTAANSSAEGIDGRLRIAGSGK